MRGKMEGGSAGGLARLERGPRATPRTRAAMASRAKHPPLPHAGA